MYRPRPVFAYPQVPLSKGVQIIVDSFRCGRPTTWFSGRDRYREANKGSAPGGGEGKVAGSTLADGAPAPVAGGQCSFAVDTLQYPTTATVHVAFLFTPGFHLSGNCRPGAYPRFPSSPLMASSLPMSGELIFGVNTSALCIGSSAALSREALQIHFAQRPAWTSKYCPR